MQPGTYLETAIVKYTGPGGATGPIAGTRKQTIVITKAATAATYTVQVVGSDNGAADSRSTSTITTSGTTVMVQRTCPSASSEADPYTAGSTSFVIFDTNKNLGETFTLQP